MTPHNNMRRLLVVGAISLALTAAARAADHPADEAAIRQLQAGQQTAWNAHDAKAYAALFTEDGDCVNVVGWWWKGRAEIEKKLTDAYVFVFRESELKVGDIDVRFITPELAVVHTRWTMTGARTPQGLPVPQQGIQTQLVQKHGTGWLIAAFQNTNSIPEMPFPKGPPATGAPAGSSPAKP